MRGCWAACAWAVCRKKEVRWSWCQNHALPDLGSETLSWCLERWLVLFCLQLLGSAGFSSGPSRAGVSSLQLEAAQGFPRDPSSDWQAFGVLPWRRCQHPPMAPGGGRQARVGSVPRASDPESCTGQMAFPLAICWEPSSLSSPHFRAVGKNLRLKCFSPKEGRSESLAGNTRAFLQMCSSVWAGTVRGLPACHRPQALLPERPSHPQALHHLPPGPHAPAQPDFPPDSWMCHLHTQALNPWTVSSSTPDCLIHSGCR